MKYIILQEPSVDNYEAEAEEQQKLIESLMTNEIGEQITVLNQLPDMYRGDMGAYAYAWVSGELTHFKRDNDCYEDLDAGYQFHYTDGTEVLNYATYNRNLSEYKILSAEETSKFLKPIGYMKTEELGIIITPNVHIICGVKTPEKYLEILKTTGILAGGPETARLLSESLTPDLLSQTTSSPQVMKCGETLSTILEIWENQQNQK